MEINDNVVAQGIVFASILAGFTFAVAAQIVMGGRTDERTQGIATWLFISGLSCLGSVALGIIYFANAGDIEAQESVGRSFLIVIASAFVSFVSAMAVMFHQYVTHKRRRMDLMVAIVLILSVVVMGFLSTGD